MEQGSVYVHRFKTKKHTQDYTQKGTTKSFAKGKLGTMKQKNNVWGVERSMSWWFKTFPNVSMAMLCHWISLRIPIFVQMLKSDGEYEEG